MEGFFLTVIWILMVFPAIVAVIGMAPLVVSTILAGVVWGIGFGLIRLALLRYIR